MFFFNIFFFFFQVGFAYNDDWNIADEGSGESSDDYEGSAYGAVTSDDRGGGDGGGRRPPYNTDFGRYPSDSEDEDYYDGEGSGYGSDYEHAPVPGTGYDEPTYDRYDPEHSSNPEDTYFEGKVSPDPEWYSRVVF